MGITGITTQIETLATQLQSFRLFHRFSMPVGNHTHDAVAVTAAVSKELTSLYSIMLQMIMLEIWALVVLLVLAIVVRKNVTHNVGVVNVSIWNSQASPFSVILAVLNYREHIPLYALGWALLAIMAWAGSVAFPTFVTKALVIAYAAPVNQNAVYSPYVTASGLNSLALQLNALNVPSNLRAIDVLETGTQTGQNNNVSSNNIIISSGEIGSDSLGNPIYEINYEYTVFGSDFGLQKAPGLMHKVQGTCITVYEWLVNTTTTGDGYERDTYALYGNKNPSNLVVATSADGESPLLTAYPGPYPGLDNPNNTFALVVSSLQRWSFTASDDPWYKTTALSPPEQQATWQVATGRPVLACQQEDLWSHGGLTRSIGRLDQLPGLSPAMVLIFQNTLTVPRIVKLIQALGAKSLKSASSSQGYFFDAGSSSMQSDLERLILGAYLATKNTLAETILFNTKPYATIQNVVLDPTTNQLVAGAGDFVVYNSAFAALSVRVLIIVPTILALLFLLVMILSDNTPIRMPWGYVNSLKASVLYATLDTEHFNPGEVKWEGGSNPYMRDDRPAHVRPDITVTKRHSYSWKQTSGSTAEDGKATAKVEEKEPESPGPKE